MWATERERWRDGERKGFWVCRGPALNVLICGAYVNLRRYLTVTQKTVWGNKLA